MLPLAASCTVSHTAVRRSRMLARQGQASVKLMVSPAATAARMPEQCKASAAR